MIQTRNDTDGACTAHTGIAQIHELHQHISSARAIRRQLGVNHGTVRQWLKLKPPDPATVAELSDTPGLLPKLDPPPLPWHDWDEVRRAREDLWLYRTLFLHRAENLTTEEQQKLAGFLAGPVGDELRVARTFREQWFAIWEDDPGNRRTPHDAERQYQIWSGDAEAAKMAPRVANNSIWMPTTSYGSTPSSGSGMGTNQQCRRTQWARISPRPRPTFSAAPGWDHRGRSKGARVSQEGMVLLARRQPDYINVERGRRPSVARPTG